MKVTVQFLKGIGGENSLVTGLSSMQIEKIIMQAKHLSQSLPINICSHT
uniref:Uncharacterized protein n=1 Tax=Rhizophora mucronata TaxID=61149 RepID=A0A2P2IWD1_RHIMU